MRTPIVLCDNLYFSYSYQYGFATPCPELLSLADNSSFVPKTRKKTRRIYAARTDTEARRIVNERELIGRLENMGFEILVGSQATIEDQVEAFVEAEIVVGKDGSNLTNVMYCQEGTAFVEILSEAFFDPLYMRMGTYASYAISTL